MEDRLKSLYKEIKKQEISHEDAAKQFQLLAAQHNPKKNSLLSQDDEYNLDPEIYLYDESYLKDHTVNGEQVILGVTHGSLAINAFFEMFPQENSVHLQRLNFIKLIEVSKDQRVEVIVAPVQTGNTIDFQVKYRCEASALWDVTATGTLQKTFMESKKIDIENIKKQLAKQPNVEMIYMGNPAVTLGDSYKTITDFYVGQGQVLARFSLSQTTLAEKHDYILHPLISNTAFQAVAPLIAQVNTEDSFLPFGIKEIYAQKTNELTECWLFVRLVKNSGEMIMFDADVIDANSQVIVQYSGCSLKRLRSSNKNVRKDVVKPSSSEIKQQSFKNLASEVTTSSTDISSKIQKYLTNKLSKIAQDGSSFTALEANLMDLGLESSQLVSLTEEIQKETNIELNPTLFFEYPNVKELTEFFNLEHQATFIKLLGIDAKQPPVSETIDQIVKITQPKVMKEKVLASTSLSVREPIEPIRDDIAVIGMSGLMAQSSDLDQFWNNLKDKKDLVKEIPIDHWDYRPWYDEKIGAKNKTYCKWGSFIDDVDKFDASFFNISPREAEWMDPQMRLLLQSIYATGEDAGYINQMRGTNTGVFVGACFHDYTDVIGELNLPVDPYMGTGVGQTVLANRISFLFDFTGPSIAIDTACSSSLVALHNACNALHNKECDMAFVGGANVLLSSYHYRYFSSIVALSPTGRCHSFDETADGYVPGECVASILLKPLQQAQKDGDQIYAVIKGSAALHGGYTPSLTAPSVVGEENVIVKAWEDAGINPESLSYIEAHGTGTKLGDPIEINSLKRAFKRFTKKENFCAVGSAKANIGHTEGAAGIAGVLKVILQMKHRTIPSMPNFKKLNPYIKLEKSPLYINQENEEWKSPSEVPRRAGVSSFGFSGAYAHVVIEEYISCKEQPGTMQSNSQNPTIILLSTKNEERLKEQAKRLLLAIKAQKFTEDSLAAIAYTLQVGREAMEERMAMLVGSVKELEEKLKDFVEDKSGIEDLYRGQVKRNKEAIAAFSADEDMENTIESWFHKGKYRKILNLWVKGMSIDWNILYGDTKPQYLSLPTYPFAKERHWISDGKAKFVGTVGAATALADIHPLVQQNTSNLVEQRFTSTFTGKEFFLADHVMNGQQVLPSVAYLEMARAAVEQSAGTDKNHTVVLLKDVVWSQPIIVGQDSVKVNIGLYLEDNGEIVYEIYSEQGAGTEPIVHSQGRATLGLAAEVPIIDLEALQMKCTQSSLTGAECYEIFKNMGIEYGPGHMGIETVYVGSDQILAKLCLPTCFTDTQNQFVLHPSVMDAALQASIAVMMLAEDAQGKASHKQILPIALQELEIIGKCTTIMWAVIHFTDIHTAGDNMQKIDITLCDEQGNIGARMKELSLRVLAGLVELRQGPATIGTLMLEPDWQEQAVSDTITYTYSQHVVLLCEADKISKEDIESSLSGVRCHTLQTEQALIAKRFETYAVQVFTEIKTILQSKPKGNVLVQLVIFGLGEQELLAGLAGILKTAQLENPKIMGQLIDVGEDSSRIVEILTENSQSPADRQICYQGGKRLVCYWKEVQAVEQVSMPWKDQGIYLITGGVGGLGQIFAREIARKVKNATLILTGRSALSVAKQAQLKELQALGARIEYQEVDVTKQQAVRDLLQSIQEKFGSLHGIIHGAGVIRDNFILKKNPDELQTVLAPKVAGLVNLDEASKNLPLDFFIFFSSMVGSLGNPGQADYSAANAFMDSYARYRNVLVDSSGRQGRTLSINWPLWQEGGMHVDVEIEKAMRKNTGMISMRTSSGINALYQGLASGKSQVMIMEGELSRMKECILNVLVKERTERKEPVQQAMTNVDPGLLREKTVHQLKILFGEFSKLSVGKLDIDEPLESYGIDSIMISQMNQKLAGTFGQLSTTLFFEYQTLRALSEYFIAEYAQECMKWTGLEKQLVSQVLSKALDIEKDIPILTTLKGKKRRVLGSSVVAESHESKEPIAIIGISGRYPQANNLKEYWDNLQNGKDCITEIPSERWNLNGFYHPSPQEAIATGKSYSKWGGFVDGFADFEPLFFNMSPREAINIDPQERMFLETCWEVIEDAGYTREQLSAQYNRRVGVFAGITKTGFSLYGPDLWKQGEDIFPSTSFGSVANRVSYLFNLQGPSMPIDTMCSSSLTAIHEACEHLQHGECEMAIAGGVNLYLHPSSYIGLCGQLMLSTDGQCKSFGQGGNGFVPGEGAGCVLLKPLSRAVADKDHIYAVIRGTSINHDGKTNGYTVPSPTAQGEVIRQALDKAGVNARTVSYIEAHGTGTELGDPIEISGLTQAFRKDSPDTQFCAIGSAKSNIGHLEAAAGIAGLSKIVLQMQHQKLVPSLHSKLANPNIKFEQTPFVVQQELVKWKRPVVSINGISKEYPRIAGISGFGAGGSNAHIVIEEYIPENKVLNIIRINEQNPVIIVLSAKNEEGLNKQAKRLLAAVVAQEFTEDSLVDIAYTLQVGREAMEERMAMLVWSITELTEKLTAFVDGKDGIEDLYQGQVKRNKEALAVFAADDDMMPIISAWINKRKYGKLLDLWVKGLIFDWQKLYGDALPCRISLPTYAFAKKRYWIPKIDNHAMDSSVVGSTLASFIHPLVQQNTSNFSQQRFSSTFTGQEFFLADHVVKGQKVLPGVAYLEMAREAVKQATAEFKAEQTRIVLTNVVWARPIVVGEEPIKVSISLYLEDKDEIAYEIYSAQQAGTSESIVHSQGRAVLRCATKVPILDIEALQATCQQSSMSSAECYEIFKMVGIEYGPGHQGIVAVYVGLNQVLAKLRLPSCAMNTQDQFVLHPSVMDSALQASIGLMMLLKDGKDNAFPRPVLPFALQKIEILHKCTTDMWALIRYNAHNAANDKVQKLDIDVCDEQGNVCVRMKGYTSRVLEGKVDKISKESTESNEFYSSLSEKIAKGELSEEQLVEILKES